MSPLQGRPLLVRFLMVAFILAAAVSSATPASADDFSSMPVGYCIGDGSTIGTWMFVYDGFGCTGFVSLNGNTVLLEQPQASTQPPETHAGLVVGLASTGDVTVQADVATTRQLRTGSAPNAWEVGWLLWRYTDNQHFYYFIPKPNGWELGKADPAYPGGQRFLATGSSPQFPIGPWYRVRVVQTGGTIQVYVNNLLITTFTDTQTPYTSGRAGLYTEDAEVYFDNVSVTVQTVTKGKKK
jgi:hypothetical protein